LLQDRLLIYSWLIHEHSKKKKQLIKTKKKNKIEN